MSNVVEFPSGDENDGDIKQGDAIIVISPDGSVKCMTVGIDKAEVEAMESKQVEDMTEHEMSLLVQGHKAVLLTMAAGSSEIMDFLAKVSILAVDQKPTTGTLNEAATVAVH